ncbi:lipid A biosynthesis acyltransferase [Leptobacterium flavescens]|uniref:Lipid A biosynthesis acyltransferase n=1 Tax=Leptobacterium flavescens TaxID=472055 RepID=A0A6P0UJM1_9FLAO|nr:lysophospholipid acyltransferase family protein [Leptobacterium flavescens]NER13404.1 lipid A biosynthesis acyltransferase [Leptobacterium flavescens]
MQLLIFILAYPFLWLVSKLPFRLLYMVSDAVRILVYHIFGYRKKVVRTNLKLAFPEKSASELKAIEKEFYKHMCDMFLEMIKTMSISEKEMQKRFSFTNLDLILQLEKEKSILLMFPHYASWEWVIALNKHIESKGYAVYKKISNVHFDRLMRSIREKFGTTLIETKETPATIISNKRKKIKSMYGFLSDQSPLPSRTNYWSDFMKIKVPVHTGAETLAKRLDLAVVFLKVEKLKRGYYSASFEVLAEHPKELEGFQITDLFLRETEKQIEEDPAYYFWTHRRWKHRNKVPEKFRD